MFIYTMAHEGTFLRKGRPALRSLVNKKLTQGHISENTDTQTEVHKLVV